MDQKTLAVCYRDRIIASLLSHHYGDAVGYPFEFERVTPKPIWTGKLLNENVTHRMQYVSREILAGQPSDDTEMTQALIQMLLDNNMKYTRENAIKAYMHWANYGKSGAMGRNTRACFHGILTLKGYEQRKEKRLKSGEESKNQSNGSLMRCLPLAWYGENALIDTALTNDNDCNKWATKLYLEWYFSLLNGQIPDLAENKISEIKHDEIKKYLGYARTGTHIDINGKDRGWVVYILYVAAYMLIWHPQFGLKDLFDIIYKKWGRSDVDTIFACVGGLYGAYLGLANLPFDDIIKLHNYEALRNNIETFADSIIDMLFGKSTV